MKNEPIQLMSRAEADLRNKAMRRVERQIHRKRIATALVRDPALGLALLFSPLLERLRDKAQGIIQGREDAEFERAVQIVQEKQAKERAASKFDPIAHAEKVQRLVKSGATITRVHL